MSMMSNLIAQSLSTEEEKQLLTQTQAFYTSIDKMIVQDIVNLTYPALYMKSGGKEKFTQHVEAMKKHHTKNGGFTIIKSTLGKPFKIVNMGDEEVVFIPRTCSLDVGDAILNKETYAIAIRSKDKTNSWHFIDGDFFGPDPKAMFNLLTALPKDTKLPVKKSTTEKKEDKSNKQKMHNKAQ